MPLLVILLIAIISIRRVEPFSAIHPFSSYVVYPTLRSSSAMAIRIKYRNTSRRDQGRGLKIHTTLIRHPSLILPGTLREILYYFENNL